MIRQQIERGRWWTTETTTYEVVSTVTCRRCGHDGYGLFGDGYRCHGCGRIVENVGPDGLLLEDDACETPRD